MRTTSACPKPGSEGLEALEAENALLREKLTICEEELVQLHQRKWELEQRLSESVRHAERLDAQLADRERVNRACRTRHSLLEQQASRLLKLYVAMHRLHEAVEHQQVVMAIVDIATQIIGVKGMALFRVQEGSQELRVMTFLSVERERLPALLWGEGPIGRAARERQLFVAPQPCEQSPQEVSACVPLCWKERVMGVLAFFQLLPQKRGFDAVDQELLTLLGSQAALALIRAEMHEVYAGRAAVEPRGGLALPVGVLEP
jgi:hypothetical protein